MYVGNHGFCVGIMTEKEKRGTTCFCKSDIIGDYVETKRMVSNTAAEGKPMGPSFEVYMLTSEEKVLNTPCTLCRGRRILRASPSVAGPITVADKEGKAFSGAFEIPR